jgi:hypothetical protein
MPSSSSQPNQFRSAEIIADRRDRRADDAEKYKRSFLRLHQFVEKVIGPWATQARISQLIAIDFDEMRLDQSVKDAVRVSFGKDERFVQIAPSRISTSTSNNQAVHRGVTEQEIYNGQAAVRLYISLFSEVKVAPGGTTPYKDVHQDLKTGKITIYTGIQQNPILWVNAGQPLRALKWMEKYKVEKKPGAKPIIRSFCLPLKDYVPITQDAILEHDAKSQTDKSFNVDRHYASDQFGIRGPALTKLQEHAMAGSLITYTDDPSYSSPAFGGKIMSAQVLRARLGVPEETVKNANVWVDPGSGEFAKKDRFAGVADKLMNIYGIWFGNEHFLSEKMTGIPRMRRLELMRDYLREYDLPIPSEYWQRIVSSTSPAAAARSLT